MPLSSNFTARFRLFLGRLIEKMKKYAELLRVIYDDDF
jgi:hypothetical protein